MVAWVYRKVGMDALLAAACAAVAVGPAMDSTLFGGSPYLPWRPPLPVTVPLAALVGAAALVRRRHPLALVAAALVGWAVAAVYPAVVLGQYTLGAHGRSRRRVIAATAVVTAAVAVPFRRQGLDSIIPLSVAVVCAPTLLGLWVGGRRAQLADLRDRAERAEREQRLLVERARAEERARIAHDMHDVVTHRVSLMVLHATAAEVAVDGERRTLVRQIRAIGREALDELRALVGVLHTGSAPTAPQPTMDDLPRLVQRSTDAGIPLTLHIRGPARRLPALVEQAGYRIVQEALTNVHKHAGTPETTVDVHYEPECLTITVTNQRPDHRGGDRGPLPAGGHGLIGLRERIRLAGGRLETGPTASGGFRLAATIPLPPERR